MVVNLRLFVGRQLDGIWHTGIVAYGREYFFGPAGIQSVRPVSIHSATGGSDCLDRDAIGRLVALPASRRGSAKR